jgi:hypothetical protein
MKNYRKGKGDINIQHSPRDSFGPNTRKLPVFVNMLVHLSRVYDYDKSPILGLYVDDQSEGENLLICPENS